jgi:hypothetical protein
MLGSTIKILGMMFTTFSRSPARSKQNLYRRTEIEINIESGRGDDRILSINQDLRKVCFISSVRFDIH